jgi:hypothetical protein
MRYKEVGVNATMISVDYISATVIDALMMEMPSRTHDGDYDLATTLWYNQTGSLFVTDWGHLLPMGPVTEPGDEESPILQVDFTIRYSATASGAGDQYRVVYWQPLEFPSPTAHVLQAYTSSATTLGNHTWTDVPEPDDGTWDWVEIDNLELGFETLLGTGDASATVSIYEAWLTITYVRKTNLLGPVYDQDAGWCYVGVDTAYGYVWGATGSGWIMTLEFEVIDYGYTDLDIETYETNLQDCGPPPNPPQDIEFTMQSGYFRNHYPGDVDGDMYVGSADAGVLNGAYGSWRGEMLYDREADFNDDGYIGSYDAGVLGGAYGTTYP